MKKFNALVAIMALVAARAALAQAAQNLKAEYARRYQFVCSGSGLNYNSQNAKAYAIGALRNMTPLRGPAEVTAK